MPNFVDIAPIRAALERGDLVLTHSLRLAREVRHAFASVQAPLDDESVVTVAARVLPLEAWFESIWRERVESGELPVRRLLSRFEERLLWRQVIEESLEQKGDFRLLLPAVAAERASQSRRSLLLYANAYPDVISDPRFHYDLDGKVFADWSQSFDRRLKASECITREEAYYELLQLPPVESCVVVPFHMPPVPPLFARLMDHLGVGSPSDMIGRVATSIEIAPTLPGARFIDRESELAAAARWACEQFSQDRTPCAIVLLDSTNQRASLEYHLRREFGCLGERYDRLPANFSSGISLAEAPMYRDAMLGLRAGLMPLSRHEALRLVNSPFLLPLGFAETAVGLKFIKALFDLGTETIAAADFRHLVNRLAGKTVLKEIVTLAQAQSRHLSVRQSGHYWVGVIRERLAAWGWPARDNLDSMEFQQVQRLESSLDAFEATISLCDLVTYEEALQHWHAVLADTVFQPQTVRSSVQVLDAREAIGLSFSKVWVCGLDAEALPKSVRFHPFIPAAIQRELGIAEASERAQQIYADFLVSGWQQCHDEVIASFSPVTAGEETHPSEFFGDSGHSVTREVLLDDSTDQSVVELEWVGDTASPIKAGRELLGGSALLKNQALCPFKAWSDHRLGISEPTGVISGLSAAERGSFVHHVLRCLWVTIQQADTLNQSSPEQRAQWIEEAIDAGMKALESDAEKHGVSLGARVGRVCLDLEKRRVTKLVTEWLDVESQRFETFRVVDCEYDTSIELSGLNLKLRLDRIDEFPDGRRLVIDYKTGAVQRKALLQERLKEPQLPLYALLDERIEGIAYAKVGVSGQLDFTWLGEDLGLKKLSRGSDDLISQTRDSAIPIEGWEHLRRLWRSRLEALATEFVSGDVSVTPSAEACRHCSYAGICRFEDDLALFDEVADS